MEKVILCYGDSNTWGYNPATAKRFPREIRWTGRLQALLGKEYVVIEEGLNSRTVVWDDPVNGYRSGLSYLIPCLDSQKPVDLVIVMLGTNDLLGVCFPDMEEVGASMERFVRHVLKNPQIAGKGDRILLIAPPPTEIGRFGEYGLSFDRESMKFGSCYEKIAEEYGLRFADAGRWGISLAHDGVHFTPEGHGIFAKRLGERIKQQL